MEIVIERLKEESADAFNKRIETLSLSMTTQHHYIVGKLANGEVAEAVFTVYEDNN